MTRQLSRGVIAYIAVASQKERERELSMHPIKLTMGRGYYLILSEAKAAGVWVKSGPGMLQLQMHKDSTSGSSLTGTKRAVKG